MQFDKNNLRIHFKTKRNSLSKAEAEKLSSEICQNFINNLLPQIINKKNNITFSLYIPANNEVNTAQIAQYFIANNITFSYPKIISINSALEFIQYQDSQQLIANQFFAKILEPESGVKLVPNIIIMPLLAFDSNLSRLGMGGGFFDRTIQSLKNTKHKFKTIGLAYDFQRFEDLLPTIKTDQKLDFIVTQKNIFSAN